MKTNKKWSTIVSLAAVMVIGAVVAAKAACNGMKSCNDDGGNSCSGSPCSYTTYNGANNCFDCIGGGATDDCRILSCSTADVVLHTGGTCIQDPGNPSIWRCVGGTPGDPTPQTCCSTSSDTNCGGS